MAIKALPLSRSPSKSAGVAALISGRAAIAETVDEPPTTIPLEFRLREFLRELAEDHARITYLFGIQSLAFSFHVFPLFLSLDLCLPYI